MTILGEYRINHFQRWDGVCDWTGNHAWTATTAVNNGNMICDACWEKETSEYNSDDQSRLNQLVLVYHSLFGSSLFQIEPYVHPRGS